MTDLVIALDDILADSLCNGDELIDGTDYATFDELNLGRKGIAQFVHEGIVLRQVGQGIASLWELVAQFVLVARGREESGEGRAKGRSTHEHA